MSTERTSERVREQATERVGEREVGRRRVRREDWPLITGDAEYADDLVDPAALHMACVRSRYGHARIEGIDASAAEAADGVVAVYTAADLAASGAPGEIEVSGSYPDQKATTYPLIAGEKAVYAGEVLAVVVAENRYQAYDAVDLVDVDYERLDAVTTVEGALAEDAPVVHEEYDDNLALDVEYGDAEATAEAFDDADHVVSVDVTNQRLIPNAMEPRGAVAEIDPEDGRLVVHPSTQGPHRSRDQIADVLGLEPEDVRVDAPDTGGGFGSKGGSPYSEVALTAWATLQLETPVKWIATRTEAHQADHHGRDVTATAELAVDDDGTMRGYRVDARFNLGSYLVWGSTPLGNFRTLSSGQYDIPAIHGHGVAAFTNTVPIAPYRGAGRPESAYTLERVVKQAADELGMDPAELRRRNQFRPDEFPVETAVGTVYDSGNYERALDLALETIDYDDLRERQAALREEGRYLGVGFGCFVENTGSAPGRPETARVQVHEDGTATAWCGTFDHGQGHETTFSQVLADELGIPYDDITIVEGDTDDLPRGLGSFGSRSAPLGASAVVEAADIVLEQATEIASHHLEAAPADVEFEDGVFSVEGAPDRSVTIQEVAALPHAGDSPRDLPDLDANADFDPPNLSFSFGVHIAVVEVDPASGEVDLRRYLAVDDCGVQFNPTIVEGQIHGGVAQGIGQAMYEHAVYDDTATLVTGSFQDYAMPKAQQLPDIEVHETETPCPHNPTGAKGAGESGSMGSPPAVVNATIDALGPRGVETIETPLTAENVWRAIQDADE